MDDFFAKKDAKKKSKGVKQVGVQKSKPAPPATAVGGDETASNAAPKNGQSASSPSQAPVAGACAADVEVPKVETSVVVEDGWVQDTKKEVDLSGLKIAEYVPVVKDVVKDEAAEEATWAKKQIEAGIPDMQVDIGNSEGKTEKQIIEDNEKAVWKPSWRNRHAASNGPTNQGKPPSLNSQSFPSLQQTTSKSGAGGERAVGLNSFTEVRSERRGGDGREDSGYRSSYTSSSSARAHQDQRANRFESLGRR